MIKSLAFTGAVFLAIGIAGLVHPRVMMPAKRDITETDNQRVIVETRRIVAIPSYIAGLAILIGGGFIFMSTQKPKAAPGNS